MNFSEMTKLYKTVIDRTKKMKGVIKYSLTWQAEDVALFGNVVDNLEEAIDIYVKHYMFGIKLTASNGVQEKIISTNLYGWIEINSNLKLKNISDLFPCLKNEFDLNNIVCTQDGQIYYQHEYYLEPHQFISIKSVKERWDLSERLILKHYGQVRNKIKEIRQLYTLEETNHINVDKSIVCNKHGIVFELIGHFIYPVREDEKGYFKIKGLYPEVKLNQQSLIKRYAWFVESEKKANDLIIYFDGNKKGIPLRPVHTDVIHNREKVIELLTENKTVVKFDFEMKKWVDTGDSVIDHPFMYLFSDRFDVKRKPYYIRTNSIPYVCDKSDSIETVLEQLYLYEHNPIFKGNEYVIMNGDNIVFEISNKISQINKNIKLETLDKKSNKLSVFYQGFGKRGKSCSVDFDGVLYIGEQHKTVDLHDYRGKIITIDNLRIDVSELLVTLLELKKS